MEIDPVSGYPIGTIIKNAKGEYAIVMGEGKVALLSKDLALKLKEDMEKKFPPKKPS